MIAQKIESRCFRAQSQASAITVTASKLLFLLTVISFWVFPKSFMFQWKHFPLPKCSARRSLRLQLQDCMFSAIENDQSEKDLTVKRLDDYRDSALSKNL